MSFALGPLPGVCVFGVLLVSIPASTYAVRVAMAEAAEQPRTAHALSSLLAPRAPMFWDDIVLWRMYSRDVVQPDVCRPPEKRMLNDARMSDDVAYAAAVFGGLNKKQIRAIVAACAKGQEDFANSVAASTGGRLAKNAQRLRWAHEGLAEHWQSIFPTAREIVSFNWGQRFAIRTTHGLISGNNKVGWTWVLLVSVILLSSLVSLVRLDVSVSAMLVSPLALSLPLNIHGWLAWVLLGIVAATITVLVRAARDKRRRRWTDRILVLFCLWFPWGVRDLIQLVDPNYPFQRHDESFLGVITSWNGTFFSIPLLWLLLVTIAHRLFAQRYRDLPFEET